MLFYDPFDLIRLYLDISGHPAVVLIDVNDGFQVAGTNAACDGEFGIEIVSFELLFKFCSGFLCACGYTAGTLSNYYFHLLPPILWLRSL